MLNFESGSLNAIKSQTSNSKLQNMEKYCWDFRDQWESSAKFDVKKFVINAYKKHKDITLGDMASSFAILIEVGLLPRKESRTFEGGMFEMITGPWLRTVFECPHWRNEASSAQLGGINSIPDRFEMPDYKPYGDKFNVQLINLDKKYNLLLNKGPWSNSVMGCADQKFTSDIQHLILQSMVPKADVRGN